MRGVLHPIDIDVFIKQLALRKLTVRAYIYKL